MPNQYNHNSHCKYLLKVHIVLAIKYRKKLLKGSLNDDILQLIFDISKGQKWTIDTMQSDVDHLHILVDYEPTISVFDIVHRIKQLSTYRIYRKYNDFLKQYFWKENTLWSDGYFACSTGDVSTEIVAKYIATQG